MEQLLNIQTHKEALTKVTQSHHTFSYWCSKFNSLLLKKQPEIKGIEILEHCFFYTGYADDVTCFLEDA